MTQLVFSRSYRQRAFALLLGQTVNYLGSKVSLIALPWIILMSTGSAALAGVVLLCQSIPYAAAGFVIGPWLDRAIPSRVMIGADLLRGCLIGTIAALALFHALFIPLICTLAVMIGCGNIAASSAREASIPILAPPNRSDELVRLNASLQFARNGSGALGPLLAGLFLVTLGGIWGLGFDAISYLVSAFLTSWAFQELRQEKQASVEQEEGIQENYWKSLRSGLRFLGCEPVVRLIVIQSALTNFLFTPLLGLVLVVQARDVWHNAAVLGIILTGFALGNILCSVLLGMRPTLLPPFRAYGFLLLGIVTPLWVLLSGNIPIILGSLFLSGIFGMALNVSGDTALQVVTPPQIRGRTFATVVSGLAVMEPLGLGITGWLISAYGVTMAEIIAILFLSLLALVVVPLALPLQSEKHGTMEIQEK